MSSYFLCVSVLENCNNFLDSYGEICVHCNCCGRINKETQNQAIISTRLQWIKNWSENIDDPYFDTELQQRNIRSNIQSFITEIVKAMEV